MKLSKELRTIHKRGWSKSSSRGIDMLNVIESIDNPTSKTILIGEPSYRQKLNDILNKYPFSKFFKSLDDWIKKKKSLSLKQCQVIDKCYSKLNAMVNTNVPNN